MACRQVLLVLAMTGAATAMAMAGPLAERAAEAERLTAAGNPLAAIDALDSAIQHVWAQMPLTVRKALLVDSVGGYGIYAERESAVYRPGETILIYAEPVGFGYGRDALGTLQIAFDVDLALDDGTGREVLSRKDFIALETPVRYRNREFHVNMSLNLTGAPPDRYVAHFLLKDRHSDKTATVSVPFEIAE